MDYRGFSPEICFVSPSLIDGDVELLSGIKSELSSQFLIMSGARLPTDVSSVDVMQNGELLHYMAHEHKHKIMPIMSNSRFLVTRAFDEEGYSAIEAKAASEANRYREYGQEILGILLDEEGRLDPLYRHHYPLGTEEQIEVEVVSDKNHIVPVIQKITAESL